MNIKETVKAITGKELHGAHLLDFLTSQYGAFTAFIRQEDKARIKELETALQSFVDYLDSDLTEAEQLLKERAKEVIGRGIKNKQ